MPQVKGQALHVRMRNRGDIHACAGAHALTQLQTALQCSIILWGMVSFPGHLLARGPCIYMARHDYNVLICMQIYQECIIEIGSIYLTYTIMFSADWHCWVFCLEMMTFSYERASSL